MKAVIIVAGGSGLRMNSPLPKQFLPLHGKPLLFWSLKAFSGVFPGIDMIIALPHDHIGTWKDLCERERIVLPHRVIHGGETRFGSVKNSLELLSGDPLVAIHDGARPLISGNLIRSLFEDAETFGNAIPAFPVGESMRMVQDGRNLPVDRSRFFTIQTPQVFPLSLLRKAYETRYDPAFTDDASVVENLGIAIHLSAGDPNNLKVTTPVDLVIASGILQMRGNQE